MSPQYKACSTSIQSPLLAWPLPVRCTFLQGSIFDSLRGKLDGHAWKYDNLAKVMDSMPDHNAVMKGLDSLLASHLSDHHGKMSAAIDKLPLLPREMVLPNAMQSKTP